MATKTLRVFAEYTSTGFVPMPTAGNIDYGYTLGSTFPATTPTTFQTDNPDLVVTVTAMTDFYVWIRVNGTAWNPSYTRNVRVYPDSPNINNVVMNMIIATGPAGVSSYTQIVQTSNRLYFNGATTDSIYNSKFAGKTYINELNFGTAPGLATVATSGAYADLTGKPSLATVATSGLFTDLSSKPSGTAPLSYNSGTNSFVITQANTSTNGFLSSTDWNTFNNKFATPSGSTLQYVDGTGALQTFPVLASADKLVINVRNDSGVSMPKGSVVYINGATGNKPTVALSQGNSDASSAQTLGLLQTTLANNAQGNVVIVGSVIDLNTSAFTEGQQLYLSPTTAGAYTTTKPYAPNHLVYVGVVTRAHPTQGVIEVKVQNGYEMDELHDVSAQSPSNNDGLFYNTTTSLWENKSIATVLGYTPYNGTNTSIKALFSASAPLSYSDGVYSISQATTASNGYLSSTDWNTFNGKESALTFSTPLVRTTNTISINQASASTSGFLSSTDWNTFNNKGSGSGTVTSVAMTVPTGLSISGTPITTSGTLALSLTAGYVIPTTSSASNWDIAYTNRITSLTLNGSSGTATLAANVLNIPSYTLVGLGGQPALNGTGFVKISGTTISYDNSTYLTTASASSTYQTIITNPVTGTGTTNYIPKFTSSSAIGNSAITDDGTTVTLVSRALSGTTATFSGTGVGLATFGGSASGLVNSLIINNTSNTTNSDAVLTAKVAGASGGNPHSRYEITGVTTWFAGVNNTSSDAYSIAGDAGFGSATYLSIATTGASTFSGNITIDKSSPNISLNAPSGTGGQYNLNNGAGTLMWAMYSVTGGSNTQGNWSLYSAGKTGGAGNVMDVTPAGYFSINSAVTSNALVNIKQIGVARYGGINLYDSSNNTFLGLGNTGSLCIIEANYNTGGYTPLALYTGGSEQFRITTTGNIGIAVNPSSWDNTLSSKAMQFIGSYIYNYRDTNLLIGNNAYYDGTWRYYKSSIGATKYNMGNGGFDWAVSTGGTAGAAISFTTAMTILSNGNIGIGMDSSPYNRVSIKSNSATQYAGLAVYAPSNGNWIYVNHTGSIGIIGTDHNGTAGSGHVPLTLWSGNDERIRVNVNGNISINYLGDAGYRLYVSGAIYATSNITANSDLTLKKNLKLIDNPIDKLMSLNGYLYQWKENNDYQYGVIAQEVEKILPYAVSTTKSGIKGVSYNQITPLLIEGFKTHESEITQLKKKVIIQQAEIDTLKSKLA